MTEPARTTPPGDAGATPTRPLEPRPLGPRPLPDRPGPRQPGPAGTARTHGTAGLRVVQPMVLPRAAAPTRRPVHVAVAVGMTAGLYALTLAGVTALQSATDSQLAADHLPAAGAVAQLKNAHDAMEQSLDTLAGTYAGAADGYQAVSDGILAHERALAALRQQVKAAAGSAAALSVPTFTSLPIVSSRVAAPVGRPAVHACTSASGKPC